MAGPLRIFTDTQYRQLVNTQLDPTVVAFPNLVQGEQPVIDLYFLDPTNGTPAAPYSWVSSTAGLSGASIKLAIIAGSPTGGPDTAIASQFSWTAISNGFEATLNCDTIGISNALASASSVACTAEIQVIPYGGTAVKYFQGALTIRSAVIDSNTAVPARSSVSYLRFISDNGLYARDLGVNNDGSARDDFVIL